MRPRFVSIAFLGFAATLFGTGPAWAYLDPGTGSMILQVLLGGVTGAIVVGKLYWHRLQELVTSRFSGKPSEDEQARNARTSSRTNAPGE